MQPTCNEPSKSTSRMHDDHDGFEAVRSDVELTALFDQMQRDLASACAIPLEVLHPEIYPALARLGRLLPSSC